MFLLSQEELTQLQMLYGVTGIAFNIAVKFKGSNKTLSSITPTNPILGTVVMGAYTCLVGSGWWDASSLPTKLFLTCFLARTGIMRHLTLRRGGHLANNYRCKGWWLAAVSVNTFGFGLNAMTISWPSRQLEAFCAVVLLVVCFARRAIRLSHAVDRPFGVYYPAGCPVMPHKQLQKQCRSQYVTMRDGVKIAVDVYLPPGTVETGRRVPTILHITRYNRSWSVRKSFLNPIYRKYGETLNYGSQRFAEIFVPSGYAWVTCDTRGTGASGGDRSVPTISPDEVADVPEILDWVVAQSWCNGNIGAMGIGYDGMTAIEVAATGHPAVKAIAPVFCPVNILEDVIAPGGVFCKGFVESYGAFTRALESNRISDVLPLIDEPSVRTVLGGLTSAKDVNGDTESLQRHVAGRTLNNIDVMNELEKVVDKDGAAAVIAKLAQRGRALAVYTMAGYFDAASVRSTLLFTEALDKVNIRAKCTVGPWTHGCRRNSSPFSSVSWPAFDVHRELLRFFDSELRLDYTAGTILTKEPRFRFWEMGVERWRHAARGSWDLVKEGATSFSIPLKLSDLSASAPTTPTGVIEYTVDPNVTSGRSSRWNLVKHLLIQPVSYRPIEVDHNDSLLTFTTATGISMDSSLVLGGRPVLTLCVENANGGSQDVAIFAYLLLEKDGGEFVALTEGCRAHTLQMTDSGDGLHMIEITMQSVCVTIPRGARIRLCLSGADKDNFSPKDTVAKAWKIHPKKCTLDLPVHR
eukprot:PhM_4_TR17361/c0_g1_i1/m.35267/K06978/K06978; uncharacterized protein